MTISPSKKPLVESVTSMATHGDRPDAWRGFAMAADMFSDIDGDMMGITQTSFAAIA